MKQLFDEHTAFTLETFKKATPESSLKKLDEELVELRELISTAQVPLLGMSKKWIAEEYVDCIMCLVDSAARIGIDANFLEDAFKRKLNKNKSRKWKKNRNNTYSHY